MFDLSNALVTLLQAAVLTFAHKIGDAERVLKQIQNHWPEWALSYVTYGILIEGQKRSDEAKSQLGTAIARTGLFLFSEIYNNCNP